MIVNIVSLTPSMLTILSKQQISDICMTNSSYDVPTTTKTMVLLTTFTSSRQPTHCLQARERSITSQHSHISGRSDTPDFKPAIEKYDGRSDPSIWLKMYSIAVRASRGNEDHMAGYFPLVMGKAPLLWLDNLPAECITSWATLSRLFTTNY
jgi:hypothetical protein